MTEWIYKEIGKDKPCDIFIAAPTVGLETKYGNNNIHDPQIRHFFKMALDMEKGIFEDSCRMFAPYYRQATMPVFYLDDDNQKPFNRIAYNDIKEAFLDYYYNYNNGRPFILWGFSQGARMCLELIRNLFTETEFMNKMVACYAIGWRITEDDLAHCPRLKMAQSAEDTGTIISFNSEFAGVEGSILVPCGTKTIGINPLSWSTDCSQADKNMNKGAKIMDLMDGRTVSHEPCFCGAKLDERRGTLIISDLDEKDYPDFLGLGKGVMHLYDYMLFHDNLKENIIKRIISFKNSIDNI